MSRDYDTVSIVAGGWSVAEVRHGRIPGYVIAVNGAAEHLRRAVDEVVTMDRLWFEHYWPLAYKMRSVGAAEPTIHVRNHACKRFTRSAEFKHAVDEGWVRVFENSNRPGTPMTRDTGWLHGTNSGAVAINRAYMLLPKRLYLFGFDMRLSKSGEAYWYKPYPWALSKQGSGTTRYARWADEFALFAKQLREAGVSVVNVSRHSMITCWPRVSARELGFA